MSDVDERAVDLVIKSSKISAQMIIQVLKDTHRKTGNYFKEAKRTNLLKKQQPKTGKQTLQELNQQGRQTSFVQIDSRKDLSALQKELKKYAIDFSILKEGKDTYHVFFKTQDAERFNIAIENVIKDFDKNNDIRNHADKDEKEVVNENPKESKIDKTEVKEQISKEVEQEKSNPTISKDQMENGKQTKPNINQRLEKAKKEAAEFNKSVMKDKSLQKNKSPKDKGGLEK